MSPKVCNSTSTDNILLKTRRSVGMHEDCVMYHTGGVLVQLVGLQNVSSELAVMYPSNPAKRQK